MKKLSFFVLVALLIATSASAFTWFKSSSSSGSGTTSRCTGAKCITFKKFKSNADYAAYVKKSGETSSALYATGRGVSMMAEDSAAGSSKALSAPSAFTANTAESGASRVSRTNVQVAGIDEPDILKTDGSNIYYSPNTRDGYYGGGEMPMMKTTGLAIMPLYRRYEPKTTVFAAFPPQNLAIKSTIDDAGPLMLAGKTLVVQSVNSISGYNVANAGSPSQNWSIKFESNQNINTSRLYGGTLYVVVTNWVGNYRTCPVPLYTVGSRTEKLLCTDIYYPSITAPAETIYSVLAINPQTGAIKRRTAFIAPSGNTVVYMSPKAIYLAYNYQEDQVKLLLNFMKTNGRNLYPNSVISKIEKLYSYDLSQGSKQGELYQIIDGYNNSLTDDQRLQLQTEAQNRFADYLKKHQRDLDSTGIAKINISNLSLVAGGVVPGRALNQFALDEYNDYLRIAVTSDQNLWLPGGLSGRGESVSDVYVLDRNLNITSAVKDLGKTERIYGVRFIEDMGYVVTFRQVDPLYVLDLANPRNPKIAGELKIPGYSAYLHPINADTLIGVGKEDNKVKISLFDVSDPYNPREIAKYSLNEWWTDVENNHHSFLMDRKHKVFFLPASQGGYVISYDNYVLSLKKVVSGYGVKRALYLDHYMYIVGDNKITVFDENNWSTVKELNYKGESLI